MLAAVIMAVVGAGIGHAARRYAPKLARVKDQQGIRVPWPEVIGALLFGGAGWVIGFDAARIPVYLYTAAFVGILVTDVRYPTGSRFPARASASSRRRSGPRGSARISVSRRGSVRSA